MRGDSRLVFAGNALSWLTHLGHGSIALYYAVDRRLTKFGDDLVVVANGSKASTAILEAGVGRYRQRTRRWASSV